MKNFFCGLAEGTLWAAQAPMMPLLRAIYEAKGKPVLRLRLTMAVYGFLVWQSIGLWVAMMFDFILRTFS